MRISALTYFAVFGGGFATFMRLAIIIFSVAIFAGCSNPTVHTHRFWNEWRDDPKKYGDTFDWSTRSPVQFLEVLKQSGNIDTALGLHHDWICDSDIEPLISRLDSQTPCAYVVSATCSQLPRDRSTEGREAAYLLEGYRRHHYPAQLSSGNFEPDSEGLRQWFRVWSARR